jgi:AAA+ superfamily predicted ATPase
VSALGPQLDEFAERWRILLRQWHDTRELWDDAVRDRFEQTTWNEFERSVPAAIESLERLARLVAKMEGSFH